MFVCRAFSLVRFGLRFARLGSGSFGLAPHSRSVFVVQTLFATLSGLASLSSA